MANLDIQATNVFERNFNSNKKIKINRGGTRSGKTYAISQIIVIWLLTGYITSNQKIESGICTIVRKNKLTLKNTVLRDFEEILSNFCFLDLVEQNKTNRTYSFNKRTVEFIGADDEQKLRGSKRNILFCNEANELNYKKEFFQLFIRTENFVFLDFNPSDKNIWINKELEQKRYYDEGDVDVIVSSYKDNSFLSQELIREIELLKKHDANGFGRIYGEGEYVELKGNIFDNWQICNNIPSSSSFVARGLDFGFSIGSTAIVDVYREKNENILYLDERLYEKGLTYEDIDKKAKENEIDVSKKTICDQAEPRGIENLRRKGWKAVSVRSKEVEHSINVIKQFKIFITARSKRLIKEFETYKWQQDINGEYINKPVKVNDHGIDAFRYVVLHELDRNLEKPYSII